MNRSIFFILFVLLASLTGCASTETRPDDALISSNIMLTEAQTGKEILAQVGQQIDIRLPSNRSTGYQWTQTEPMRGALRDASPLYEPTNPEVLGSGGTDVFHFTAARPGKQALKFEYARTWVGSPPASQKVNYVIIVE
ncbi:MAG: protease inhibitor I42 family protein [Burkholderiales bacterium]|jgi:inhibitor of cysteine peptidase|nr:protease inhibitor I42 family protein [Burkholderiales bacterium]